MVRFCSIATRYALPNARVLASALTRHHPDAGLTLLLLDDAEAPSTGVGFEVVRLHDLDAFPADLELGEEAWADVAAVAKPLLMQLMLDRQASSVIFLEADVDVVGSLDPAIAPAEAGGTVLMPRVIEALPDDGLEPSARELLELGQVSSALVGAGAGGGRTSLPRVVGRQSHRDREIARPGAAPADQPGPLPGSAISLARCRRHGIPRTADPARRSRLRRELLESARAWPRAA